MILVWVIPAILAVGYLVHQRLFSRRHRLPPGPKPWPLIGNIADMPPVGKPEHEHWLKHKDLYGPVSSVTVMGRPLVILHSREAIRELMEKTSTKTSGRPALEFGMMCGYGDYFSLHQYTDEFRMHRKFVHRQLGTKDLIMRYQGVLETEVAHLLLRVLETPQDLLQHFRTEAAGVILKIVYGYTVEPRGVDPLVKLIDHEMAFVSAAFLPLAWAVDILPALKYLPEWFPGGGFQKTARLWKRVHRAVVDLPYALVLQRVKDGTDKACYISRNVEEASMKKNTQDHIEPSLTPEAEDAIKASAAALYAGGSDTTVATLTSFILAMIKFPHVQREAQREIDALIGSDCDRLPGLADREKLPYVDAIITEALRWFPITAMGTAHAVSEDATVMGYDVPKGSYLLPGTWWLLHDPEVYPDPETFDPTRFLAPRDEPHPSIATFGFGRRMCPGRHLADVSLFLTVAQLLATFDVERALDADGRPMAEAPRVEREPGMIGRPVAFPYRIVPRSPKHADLIKRIQLDYPWEESDAGALPGAKALHDLLTELGSPSAPVSA